MKTYIVAYISFFDNQMHMSKVMANSEVEAMTIVLHEKGWETDEHYTDPEKLKQLAFDCDSMIGAIEI